MGGLRLLIADDHAILRFGLRRLLGEMAEVDVIGEAGSSARVQQMLREEHWDFLVLDLDMPGQNVLDMLKRAKLDHPDLAVLILSMYPEEQFAMRALKAGAAGYLNKQSAPEQLTTAVRIIAGGGTYISAALAAGLTRSLHAKPLDTINELLSDREFTVLRGIACGHSVSQIAQTLNLSAKTVSTYRTRLLAKLGVRSNVELARYADEHGLVK